MPPLPRHVVPTHVSFAVQPLPSSQASPKQSVSAQSMVPSPSPSRPSAHAVSAHLLARQPSGQTAPHAPQFIGSTARLKPSSTTPLQSLSLPSQTSPASWQQKPLSAPMALMHVKPPPPQSPSLLQE